MSDDATLDELVSVWQQEKAKGRDLAATEICRGRPELAAELERRIGAVRRMGDLAVLEAATLASSPPASEDATLAPGPRDTAVATGPAIVPGYEVLGTLGRGGMGVVYRARQTKLGRVVALKMILSGAHAGEADLARFRTEAEAIARLQHPNIVQIYEVGDHGGLPYFSLEFCGGGSLEKKLAGTPLPAREAAALVETLARAMQAAHAKGVIHRDLKPANVLLAEEGTPKITDFGLAKKLDEVGQTATGAVMGTPSYMAPEQAGGDGAAVGPAADVYALGAILYECLTGRPPFRGPTAMDTIMQVVADEPPPPTQLQPHAPRDLETICLKCLHKQPARRYDSARALAEDLARFRQGDPIHGRRVGRLERGAKWARKHPAASLLYATMAAIAAAVVFGLPYVSLREQRLRWAAQQNEQRALDNLATATANEQRANGALADLTAEKHQTTDLLYATRINLSHREWQGGNAHRARQLLYDCPEPLRGWEWDFLKGLYDERSLTLTGHSGILLGVALTPDGSRAVTFGADRTVRVWDARSGSQLHQFDQNAHLIAVSPDGKRVAVAADFSVKAFDMATGEVVFSRNMGEVPCGLGYVRDGADLGVALERGGVLFLDPATGKERSRLAEPVKFLPATRALLQMAQGVAFSPDGRWLAQGGTANVGQLRVWDAATGKVVLEDEGHLDIVRQVAFSPDGRRLASPGGEGDIRVWDMETKKSVIRLIGHRDVVHCVAFSPDGRRLVSGGKDMTVRVWDADTGENVLTLAGHGSEVYGVAFAAGNRAASASMDGTARVWDVDERMAYAAPVREFFEGKKLVDPARRGGHEALTLLGYMGPVWDVAFSPDGQTLAAAGQLGPSRHANPTTAPEVTVWDIAGRRVRHELSVPQERQHHLAFSPDGRLLIVGTDSGGRDVPSELNAFEQASGRRVWHWEGPRGENLCPAFSPSGARLASTLRGAKGENFLLTWQAEDGKELYRQPLDGPHSHATYSSDGKLLVAAGAVGTTIVIEKYDAETGQQQGSWPAGAAGLYVVACGPDGLVAAATTGDRPAIKLYRLADGHEVASLEGHVGLVTSLAFSPDGRRLLSCGSDFTVRVWHTGSGRELLTLREHINVPLAVAWSPDGRRIASAGHDRTIRVWEARPAEPAPQTDDWLPLIHDTFAADGDLGLWKPTVQSPWEVRDGSLRGRQVNLTLPGGSPLAIAAATRTDLKLPRTAEVSFAYRAERPLVMGVHLAATADAMNAYTVLLSGGALPFGVPCARLQRMTEGLKVSYVGMERSFAQRLGEWHNVRVVRQPKIIRVYVDGAETLTEAIPDVELPYLSLLGEYGAAGDEIEFKDVKVRAPAEAGR